MWPSVVSVGANGSGSNVGSAGQATRAGRSHALDVVKGLLVLLMVLYHWLNYFVTRDGDVYMYLRFITSSFIFIAGFLISGVYLARYRRGERGLQARLLVRGLKLLALFTVLNLGANLMVKTNYDGSRLGVERFMANAFSTYVSGSGSGVAFEVLVPIGYLLVASSVWLYGCKLHRHFLVALLLGGVAVVDVLRWRGLASSNVELVTMGLWGMVVGQVSLKAIDRETSPAIVWIGIYALYVVTLNVYDVTYELQVLGVIVNLVLLYILARRVGETSFLARMLGLLGQYSLLAYVAQIAILQLLVRAMQRLGPDAAKYILSLGAALVLTILAVEATGWARRRWLFADRLYRVVFA